MIRSTIERLRTANRRRTVSANVVGYPKTGNTWLRYMLGSYAAVAYGLPAVPLFDEFDRWGRAVRAGGFPGVTFTHAPLTWASQTADDLDRDLVVAPFEGSDVVLLVRYPLDVLVSAWHQERTRARPPYEGSLQAFLRDPVFGIEKLLRFYGIWAEAASAGFPVTVVRYEDLQTDAGRELRRVLDVLGIEVDAAAAEAAVDRASFESMRALERSGRAPRYSSSGLGIFGPSRDDDPDAYHVRRGRAGGYRDELDPTEARGLEDEISAGLPAAYAYTTPPAASLAV
jgi:hypothetical protein